MQVMLLQIYGALLRKIKAQGVSQQKIEYDSKKRLLR